MTADGYETEYEYDPLFGLLSRTTRLDGEILIKDEFVYDEFGNLIRSESTSNHILPLGLSFIDAGTAAMPNLIPGATSLFVLAAPVSSLSTGGDVMVASSVGVVSGLTLNGFHNAASDFEPFPIVGIAAPELPALVRLNEYQYDQNGNRVVAVSSSSLDPGVTSTTTFTFENNQVVDIVVDTSSVVQSIVEYHVEYDAQGRLLSCGQQVASTLLKNFPQAVITPPVGGYSQSCSDIVEYDDLGRVIRIERPATDISRGTVFYTGSIREIEYLGDKIVLIRVDNNADSEFEEIREFDYSITGEVIEERIIRDGELVFRRVREYRSMELPGIP